MKFLINRHTSIITKLPEDNASLNFLGMFNSSNLNKNIFKTGDVIMEQETSRLLVRINDVWEDITNNII